METIGDRIKNIREDYLHMSQRSFSKRTKISQPTLSLLEKNKRNCKSIYAQRISDEFDINLDYLLFGTEPIFKEMLPEDETAMLVSALLEDDDPMNELIKRIMIVYRKLDEPSKKAVQSFIQELIDN